MGTKRVRLAKLLPEIPDEAEYFAFSNYGEIKEIQEERWSRAYRYSVANGIRFVVIVLTKHIHSHMTVAGNGVLVSNEGQPTTCYGYGETGIYTRFSEATKNGIRSDKRAKSIMDRHCGAWE